MDGMQSIGSRRQDAISPGFLEILYAEDFDGPDREPPPAPEPERIAPLFTLDELKAAQTVARKTAVDEARADWELSDLHARTQALAALATAVAETQGQAHSMSMTVAEGVARTMLSMAAALLPAHCQIHGEAEVRAVLRRLLPRLTQQPRVSVRLHPAVLDSVRHDLSLLDEELTAAVSLTANPALSPGDVKVAWTDGSFHRDTAAISAAVRTALADLGLIDPEPEPAAARPPGPEQLASALPTQHNHLRSFALAESN